MGDFNPFSEVFYVMAVIAGLSIIVWIIGIIFNAFGAWPLLFL